MRSNGSGHASIGRRRGTRGRKGGYEMILNPKSLLVLLALCATIFGTGLVVGTRLFGAPDASTDSSGSADAGGLTNADASPLAAAAKKIAAEDIQNLILESAKAEAIEKKEHELEEEALARGDTKLAAHLRGVLAPGDANYNPHHHVDDFVDGDGIHHYEGNEVNKENKKKLKEAVKEAAKNVAKKVGGGDGAMYAGDHGDHGELGDKKKTASKDFDDDDKMKHGREPKKGSDKQKAPKEKPGLRGAAAGGNGNGNCGEEVPKLYPYMVSPVSKDYDFSQYEPLGGNRFCEYKDGDAPYEITQQMKDESDELARSRRVHVKAAMQHIWRHYKDRAFGKDEIKPISGGSKGNWGGMGTTLVDSLDTLWLMDMKEEFWEARDWVRDHLSCEHVNAVSGFETTIRSLGGLLAAYDLSNDKAFLEKAEDLGSRLIKAYNTPSGLPHGSINLSNGRSNNFSWNSNAYILAEVGTQQLEYRYLSRATGKEHYAKKSEHVFDILHELQPEDGLLSQNLKDAGKTAKFTGSKVSFGAMGDSTYEYMIKIWVQGARKERRYREMWDKAMNGVHKQLVQKSEPRGLTFIADRVSGQIDRKMDHLVCFMGGALALGAYTDPKGLDSERAQRDLRTARALTYTCYQMYARTRSGIAPEYVDFKGKDNDMTVPSRAPFYILRPETVEALYYLSKLTGDPVYREMGWEIFQSIEKYCKSKYGYASLKHVDNVNSQEDRMESFFMAETLKYLYLLFDPDSEIDPLNKHVFNTEAHPLRIFEES
ncbi:hypothetical protein ACHAXT_012348 [Thalassiosira profunda]